MQVHAVGMHDGFVSAIIFTLIALCIFGAFRDRSGSRTAAGQIAALNRPDRVVKRRPQPKQARQRAEGDEGKRDDAVVDSVGDMDNADDELPKPASRKIAVMDTRQRAPPMTTPPRPQVRRVNRASGDMLQQDDRFAQPQHVQVLFDRQGAPQRQQPEARGKQMAAHEDASAPPSELVAPVRLAPLMTAEEKLFVAAGLRK